MPTTQEQKILYSLKNGLLFLLISLPATYKLTNMLGSRIGYPYIDANGCPTMAGILVHTLVFTLVVYLSMYLMDKLSK